MYIHNVLTIRSLLFDRSLGLRLLVGGAGEVDDLSFRWVHNTELPDPSPYVRPHELVMTNGLWLESGGSVDVFVGAVKDAGAAGIVFGLRREIPNTPAELIEACRTEGMPLLELAVSVPFTAVSQAAADRYAEQRQQDLIGTVERGNALVSAVSRGGGMAGVLEVLRRDHPLLRLAVVDRFGRCPAAAGAELAPEELRSVAASLRRHPPPLEVELRDPGTASLFLIDTLGGRGGAGGALVCLRASRDLDDSEREALEQAARFLSLEAARTQLAQTIELRFASELLDMITSGAREVHEITNRIMAFGIDAQSRMAVCALAPTSSETEPSTGLAELIGGFFTAEALPVVVAESGQDVVTIFPWLRSGEALKSFAERLIDSVGAQSNHRLVAGIGDIAANAGELRTPLVEAREACRVLRMRAKGPRVADFGDLNMYQRLLGQHSAEVLRGFAADVLGPIRTYDRDRGSGLEATVQTFLERDGHWAGAAAALNVHVNTLRNRLARVTELTGRDVSRTEDRVDLFLALKADSLSRGR